MSEKAGTIVIIVGILTFFLGVLCGVLFDRSIIADIVYVADYDKQWTVRDVSLETNNKRCILNTVSDETFIFQNSRNCIGLSVNDTFKVVFELVDKPLNEEVTEYNIHEK